jgi:hypothetical protein
MQAKVWLGYADRERVYQIATGAIPDFGELCSAKFSMPMTQAQELMVWVHRVTAEGQSEHLPALLKVRMGKDIQDVHLEGASRQFVLPLGDVGKKASKGSPVEAGQLEVEVQLVPDK